MTTYMLWLSLLTPSYEKIISAALLNAGYTVEAAAADGVVTVGNCSAYRLGHRTKTLTDVDIDVLDVIKKNKIHYHLAVVIVDNGRGAQWRSTNINLGTRTKEQEVEAEMERVNKILSSYDSKLTADEEKRIREKRKNS